jgi:hypothetical protein
VHIWFRLNLYYLCAQKSNSDHDIGIVFFGTREILKTFSFIAIGTDLIYNNTLCLLLFTSFFYIFFFFCFPPIAQYWDNILRLVPNKTAVMPFA